MVFYFSQLVWAGFSFSAQELSGKILVLQENLLWFLHTAWTAGQRVLWICLVSSRKLCWLRSSRQLQCLSLHAALMIPCPVGLVKIRLPSCQLGDVNWASSQRISQPVASKMTRAGSEMLTQGLGPWFPGTAGVERQTGQLVSYGVSLPLKAWLLGYRGTSWPLMMLLL